MGVLVHPDKPVHPAVLRALDDGRLRIVSNHRSGNPWLLARHWERALTEIRTKYLDIVILSHLDGETATAVLLLAQGKRALEELDDLPMLLQGAAIVIAKDGAGEIRVEGPLAGSKRAVWLEEESAVFVSDDRALLVDIFAPGAVREGSPHQDRGAPRSDDEGHDIRFHDNQCRDSERRDSRKQVGCAPLRTVPTGMWLHTITGVMPRVRAVVAVGAQR